MGLGHDHARPADDLANGSAHGEATAAGTRRRLGLVLAITATVLLAELIGTVLTGSLALLTDAAHMLVDVGGLTMAFLAAGLVRRPATARRAKRRSPRSPTPPASCAASHICAATRPIAWRRSPPN